MIGLNSDPLPSSFLSFSFLFLTYIITLNTQNPTTKYIPKTLFLSLKLINLILPFPRANLTVVLSLHTLAFCFCSLPSFRAFSLRASAPALGFASGWASPSSPPALRPSSAGWPLLSFCASRATFPSLPFRCRCLFSLLPSCLASIPPRSPLVVPLPLTPPSFPASGVSYVSSLLHLLLLYFLLLLSSPCTCPHSLLPSLLPLSCSSSTS